MLATMQLGNVGTTSLSVHLHFPEERSPEHFNFVPYRSVSGRFINPGSALSGLVTRARACVLMQYLHEIWSFVVGCVSIV